MLEIRNLHKTYRPKKGVPVKALDGVSLSFADRGLVFILGKSGSGKSTLLNVIGGLDTADSGEFEIKGKSSKVFTGADFDSYRNTFIGFIFQEYNILNEFTVGQNIALAMKLQGKKVTDESLNHILEEVDLTGYADRKPNELSGGQKQRVAIARALIKEPEIIMADEPTGALDSNTGRQVFDTLKRLSRDKLVIVVSHDREFAEYYGDRVIELADGKIISDITKELADSQKESEGVSVVDNKILHIRKGYKLTAEDMQKIQAYLDSAQADTIISMDERSNASFCQIARIDENGNQEVFRDTDNAALSEKNKQYDGSSRFIRSRLPYGHALKIGANSVRTKPLRLVITILLCFISFTMFGLADTIGAYEKYDTTISSIMDSGYDAAAFTACERYDGYADGYWMDKNGASENDLTKLKEQTDMDFVGVTNYRYDKYEYGSKLPLLSSLQGQNDSPYYSGLLQGYLAADAALFDKLGFDVVGRMPSAADEIVITKYIYDQLTLAGFTMIDDQDQYVSYAAGKIGSMDEYLALNPKLCFDPGQRDALAWKVVGVVDTRADANGKFESLKPSEEPASEDLMRMFLVEECISYFRYGYHSVGFVTQQTYRSIVDMHNSQSVQGAFGSLNSGYMWFDAANSDARVSGVFDAVASDADLNKVDVIWLDGASHTRLEANEYVIPYSFLDDYFFAGEVADEAVPLDWDKTYFGRIQFRSDGNGRPLTLASLRNDIVGMQIAYCEAADRLTVQQVQAFRAYVEELDRLYGADYPDVHGVSLKEDLVNDFCNQLFGYRVSNADWNFDPDTMGEQEWRLAYAGYVQMHYLPFGSYDMDGGYISNAIGLTCGRDIARYGTDRIYLQEKLEKVPYSCKFDFITCNFDASSTYFRAYETETRIVGVYFPTENLPIDPDGEPYRYVFNNQLYEKALTIEPICYSFLVAPMPTDAAGVGRLVAVHYEDTGLVGFRMHNGVTDVLSMVNSMFEVLGEVFLYVGIGLAVFSMLLMSNYIAVSISHKKREIGILRAVGAKSSDVFSIFFSESIIIALINFVLALIATIGTCAGLNSMLRNEYNFQITLLNFGIRQIALMLAASIAVAILASFLPVYRLSRKKPIDTIQDR